MMDETPELGTEEYRVPDSTQYAAIGTLIGMVAVFFMVIMSLAVAPEAAGMDSAKPVTEFILLAEQYQTQITIIIVLDTIFITGYVSLFVGLWLVVRDFSEILSRVGLLTGLLVGLFDLIENSLILVLVNGLQTGWTPEPQIYAWVFLLNTFIDLLSYTAGLIFGIIYLTIFKPFGRKFILGVLLILYVIIGLSSFVIPAMFLVRSLFFVFGLIVGGIVLWKEEDIPTELLEKFLNQQKESKNEFIR